MWLATVLAEAVLVRFIGGIPKGVAPQPGQLDTVKTMIDSLSRP